MHRIAVASAVLLTLATSSTSHTAAAQEPADARDVVLFAGGTVELRPPLGWHVSEVPFRREVRLVIAPGNPQDHDDMPTDGMWLTLHASLETDKMDDRQLQELVRQRLRLAADDSLTLGRFRSTTTAQWPTVIQEFDSRRQRSGQRVRTTGLHFMLLTHWGILELHAVAPAASYEQRHLEFQQTIRDLVLRAPSPRNEVLPEFVNAAEPALGSWKAFRSRLRLYADGRIMIQPDRIIRAEMNSGDEPSPRDEPTAIHGRFKAREDLLFVHWTDGSRLNLRWRLRNDQLLLTDHDGQISQLRRILE